MDRALTTMSWVWVTLGVVALVALPFTGTTGRLTAIGVAAVVCVCASYIGWQIHGVSPLLPRRDARLGRVSVHVRPAGSRRRHGRRQPERGHDRCDRQLGARRRCGAGGAVAPRRLFASRCRRRPDGAARRDGRGVDRDRQPADRAAQPQCRRRDPQQPLTAALGDPRRVDRGAAGERARAEPIDRAARRRPLAQPRGRPDAGIDQVRGARRQRLRRRHRRLLRRPLHGRRGVHPSIDRARVRQARTACLGQRDPPSRDPRLLPARAHRTRRSGAE